MPQAIIDFIRSATLKEGGKAFSQLLAKPTFEALFVTELTTHWSKTTYAVRNALSAGTAGR